MLASIDSMKTSLAKIRTGHRTFARSTGNTAKIKAALTAMPDQLRSSLLAALSAEQSTDLERMIETEVQHFVAKQNQKQQ